MSGIEVLILILGIPAVALMLLIFGSWVVDALVSEKKRLDALERKDGDK